MGMFNEVEFTANCPSCGSPVSGFQTKDERRYPLVMEFVKPRGLYEFYTKCRSCDTWIEYQWTDESADSPTLVFPPPGGRDVSDEGKRERATGHPTESVTIRHLVLFPDQSVSVTLWPSRNARSHPVQAELRVLPSGAIEIYSDPEVLHTWDEYEDGGWGPAPSRWSSIPDPAALVEAARRVVSNGLHENTDLTSEEQEDLRDLRTALNPEEPHDGD